MASAATSAAPARSQPLAQGLHPLFLQLALFATVVGVTAWAGIMLTQEAGRIASIWLPNGIMLATVLATSRRRWPGYLGVGFGANVLANFLTGDGLGLSLILASANIVEVVSAAVPIRRMLGRAPDLSSRRSLLRFTIYGVCLAPIGTGLLAAAVLHVMRQEPFLDGFRVWVLADGLGTAIAAPVALGILRGDVAPLFRRGHWPSSWLLIAGAVLTFTVVFAQTRYPLLFLVPPVLFAVAMRLDHAGVALMTPLLTVIAVLATVEGYGPFCLTAFVGLPERIVLVQVFVLSGLLLSYWVANSTRARRAMQRELDEKHQRLCRSEVVLRESEALHRVLAENSSDIIVRSDLKGIRTYVSPSVSDILGFRPEELIGQSLGKTVHPDDQPALDEARARLLRGNERETALIRCSHKDGHWVWLEMRGRMLRDPEGRPQEFVASVNDVTRRKLAEERLAASLAELSLLAATDGLTGLANRRELDRRLAEAWRRGLCSGQSAALLMIDADHFKAYNDRYGHHQGDEALRAVANAIRSAARRPGDLPARYGGEEFAVLLPNIDGPGALVVAEAVRSAVRDLGIKHEGTDLGSITVSIGIVCLRPVVEGDHLELVVWADKALYEAKRRGRNCCVLGSPPGIAMAAE